MDDSNQLSTMSLFWGVLAIALHTMTLQSGMVFRIPSKWNFVYRMSPVFCAFATLDSMFRLAMYSFTERSLPNGLVVWTEFRFAVTTKRSIELGKLRRNTCLLFGVFLIGGLTQSIKIFATRNIIAMQVICAVYLSNYLVDALIVMCAPSRPFLDDIESSRPAAAAVDNRGCSTFFADLDADPTLAFITSFIAFPAFAYAQIVEKESGFDDHENLTAVTLGQVPCIAMGVVMTKLTTSGYAQNWKKWTFRTVIFSSTSAAHAHNLGLIAFGSSRRMSIDDVRWVPLDDVPSDDRDVQIQL